MVRNVALNSGYAKKTFARGDPTMELAVDPTM
jgi:hypothetical protein